VTFARTVILQAVELMYKMYILNAATCRFLAPELSSADGVFQLLHWPSGTLFRHTCARRRQFRDGL